MGIDWTTVRIKHVRQACKRYDHGLAVPRSSARSTFLVIDGKAYPAKFIRGLAYQLANGVTLDPSTDYAGGQETARFFARLGLQTTSDKRPKGGTSLGKLAPPFRKKSRCVKPRTYEPQKQALFDLLCREFGTVETEAAFPWLVVPNVRQLEEPLKVIWSRLKDMRGHSCFATSGRRLCCDFFIADEKLIIEYDERQHFTLQRARSLRSYPSELALSFSRQEWIGSCESIRAKDPDPVYRDEQRAFYDSLRDILAWQHGYRLIRLRAGTVDWRDPAAASKLLALIASVDQKTPAHVSVTSGYRRIAVVSHDYNVRNSQGFRDYSDHFRAINLLCDGQGCDTVLYALFTQDPRSTVAKNYGTVFRNLRSVQRVFTEIGRRGGGPACRTEIWLRSQKAPLTAHQRFAKGAAPSYQKQEFVDDLPHRKIGEGILMLCGESNIVSLTRGSSEPKDPFGFLGLLRDLDIHLVLNPIHDYMRRYEMREKRRIYSRGGRTVISVWNQGKGKESATPWTVFSDGREKTDYVQELRQPFPDRPDIRVGIVDISSI